MRGGNEDMRGEVGVRMLGVDWECGHVMGEGGSLKD